MSALTRTSTSGRRAVVERFQHPWLRCSNCGSPAVIVTYDTGEKEATCITRCQPPLSLNRREHDG